MKQFLRIKFSRPINPDRDYITFGSFEGKLKNGNRFQLDFPDYEGYIDKDDPTILNAIMKDGDEFPDDDQNITFDHLISGLGGMRGHFTEIATIEDFFVYISGDDNTLEPIKILKWKIQDDLPRVMAARKEFEEKPTEFVTFKDDSVDYTRTYTFTDKLLSKVEFLVEEG